MTMIITEPVLGTAVAAVIGVPVPASMKRRYTKCVAYNGTAGTVTIEIYLVPSTLAADATRRYVRRPLEVDETYECPEIVGSALNVGGQMYVLGLGVSFSSVANDTTN